MGQIDRYTIEELGIPGLVLMEQAGRRVMEEILTNYPKLSQVVILAGKGNNGGDGFVISRLLAQRGIEVKTILLGKKSEITGDARVNLDILAKLGYSIEEVSSSEQVQELEADLRRANLIVDALLGTGIKGKLRGLFPEMINLINKVIAPVIAVDIPSGVEADSGLVRDTAIQAQQTITFALPKLGSILYPGAKFSGKLTVVDIGVPEKSIAKQDINTNLITEDLAVNMLPRRDNDSHKGSYGKLLFIASSPGMTGAAALAAQASLKMGAGLVTVGVPKSLNQILEMKLTEAMTYPLTETKEGTLAKESVEEIKKLMSSRDVLAIGPGLSTEQEVTIIIKELIKNIDKPMVIDADGLNAIDDLNILKERSKTTILTPHPGEMSRLINRPIAEIEANRIEVAQEFATEYEVVLVLKGARTIIATPEGEIYINQTGNSALATGGSGDVLTGLITSLLGQGSAPKEAVITAVYLHGLSAELGSLDLSKYGLLPSDLIDYLPEAIKQLKDYKL